MPFLLNLLVRHLKNGVLKEHFSAIISYIAGPLANRPAVSPGLALSAFGG